MKLSQEKSQCCRVKIIRYGGKRRQCTGCAKTWRVHPAKPGRKSLRLQCQYLTKVFQGGYSVKQLALQSTLSADAIYKRFAKSLAHIVTQPRLVRVHGAKLILIIDAKWQYFNSHLWTLYFVSVKATNTQQVTVYDPVLQPGRETSSTWREILNQLPQSVKRRVVALVSDGVRGIETIATDNDWILQRCHFHLLSMIQKMRGKRASTPGRLVREQIYQTVRLILIETSKRRLNKLCQTLAVILQDPGCPKRMRMVGRDFLRKLPDFRSYLSYPGLGLPITTNVMESINSYVQRKSPTVNTPQGWHRWAVACIRFKSRFICK